MSAKSKLIALLRSKKAILFYSGVIIAAIEMITHKDLPITAKDVSALFSARGEREHCKLKRVIDGDSIIATCKGREIRVRLLGIDAPEMGQKPYGQYAKDALQNMLTAQIIIENHGLDFYQRVLAEIYNEDEQLVNLTMVREGYAVAYQGKDTPKKYNDAQSFARRNKIGVWQHNGDQQDPKKWRRYHN